MPQEGQIAGTLLFAPQGSQGSKGTEVFRELGKSAHRHLGPVEGAACWQRRAHSGKAASRAYKVKLGEGRWLVWHHATFLVLFLNFKAEGVS